MTEQDVKKILSEIRVAHATGMLSGIKMLISHCERTMSWEISDRAKALERDYNYMLDYFVAGYPDEKRSEMRDEISDTLTALTDRLERRLLSKIQPSLYFTAARIAAENGKDLSSQLNEFRNLTDAGDNLFARITSGDNSADGGDRRNIDNAASELFNSVWTAYPLNAADTQALMSYLNDGGVSTVWRSLILSAVLLGELQYHDSARVAVIADVYAAADDTGLRAQALVALILSIYKRHSSQIEKSITDRLKLLSDKESCHSELREANIELIRTSDTRRISRQMRDEIIPSMMDMRPEIMKRFEDMNFDPADPESLDINPEWEEALRKSGLLDKIKEMSELQSEGADVFMSTFAHLKNFAFFHQPAGWFTPFDPESSIVRRVTADNDVVARSIASLPFLCDSDKYSLALSIDQIPQQQRKMMFEQLDAQRSQFYEAMNEANKTAADDFRLQVRRYLQNIYRFLELFRRKAEFYNPFDSDFNIYTVKIFADALSDEEALRMTAEFYMKIKRWDDAEYIFGLLSDKLDGNDAAVWQKIGFCHENNNKIEAAIEAYRHAEMLDSRSKWLWGRLYACYRAIEEYEKALPYARQSVDENSAQSVLKYGYACLEANETEEALNQFLRAEFMDESSQRPLRPIAWTYFLLGKYDRSSRYYERIMAGKPTKGDYLNYGHLQLVSGNIRRAYELYQQAYNNDRAWFVKQMSNDALTLQQLGLSPSTRLMIVDAVLYPRQQIPCP